MPHGSPYSALAAWGSAVSVRAVNSSVIVLIGFMCHTVRVIEI